MSQANPTEAEIDKYVGHYVLHGCQSSAWRKAFPKSKAKPEIIHTSASLFHSKPKVRQRLGELSAKANKIAEKKFTISVEWRLKALKDIYDAGMGDYIDAQGGKRKEGLTAARGAIETMNNMLGTKEETIETIKPIPIGVVDAS